MQPDLLAQLRDIHVPLEPLWWPPAPGWWLLALALLILAGLALRWVRGWLRRQQPIKQARGLYAQLYHNYQAGLLSGAAYLHESNELLKRLVIHGLGDQRARKANDSAWLALLDQWAGTTEFSQGPGRLLGNQRFTPNPDADVEALHPLLSRFLRRVRA